MELNIARPRRDLLRAWENPADRWWKMTSLRRPAHGWWSLDPVCCPSSVTLYHQGHPLSTMGPGSSVTLPARWHSMIPCLRRTLVYVRVCACACVKIPRGGLVREQVIRYVWVCTFVSEWVVCLCVRTYQWRNGEGLGSFIILIWKVTPSLSDCTLQSLPVVTARQTDPRETDGGKGWKTLSMFEKMQF